MRSRPSTIVAAAVVLVSAVVWAVQYRLAAASGVGDLPVYEHASRLMRLGEVPYRDFALEYPPGGAGLFFITDLLPGSFGAAFSVVMFGFLALAVAGVTATCAALGRSTVETAVAATVTAGVPLVFASLSQLRYDLVLTALLAWLLWAVVTHRWRAVWTLIGLCLLVKLVPVVLVPLLAVIQAQRDRPTRIARAMLPGLALVLVVVGPLAAVAPSGLWDSVAYHLERPLQIEALGASLLITAHHLGFGDVARVNSYGSDNLLGARADTMASISGLVAVVLVLAIVAVVARASWRRGPDTVIPVDETIAAVAATLLAFIAFGKVLSPQYLLWLAPVVGLLGGRRMAPAAVGMVTATALSYAVFPTLYRSYTEDLAALPSWLVLARNVVLIALLIVAWPRLRRRTEGQSPATGM